MTQLPPEPLVPDKHADHSTPEEGRALNITLARHSIHAMQKEVEVLRSGRAQTRATQIDCVKSCGGGGVSPRSPRLTTTGAGNAETEAPPKRPRI
jgi:Hexameric tyrosine-coordinated heme protein (HTHP)